jgi:hypothetical protein
MRAVIIGAVFTATTALWIPAAHGQSPPAPPAPPAPQILGPGPKECPPDVRSPPRTSSDRPLSEQLSDSKGIICPPAGVDPEIVGRPPPTGDNLVIAPPGSPGGNQRVVPKE